MNNFLIPDIIKGYDALSKYIANMYYDNVAFNKEFFPYYIDTWKEKKWYGLINGGGEYIFPKDGALGNYTKDNGTKQKNIFFVLEAFADLKKYHDELIQTNRFDKSSSLFIKLNPTSGYVDPTDLYIEYVRKISTIFIENYARNAYANKIKTIDIFLEAAIKFVELVAPNSPLTRSGFLKDRKCPIEANGLTISLDEPQFISNIEKKIVTYLNDPNFNTFVENAKRFGFYVDKNIPWRIMADLESPVMKSYYTKYNIIDTKDIFDKLYFKAHLYDLDIIKKILLGMWNVFAADQVVDQRVDYVGKCNDVYTNTTARKQIDLGMFEKHLGNSWFLRFYLFTKIKENNVTVSQNKFETMHKKACILFDNFSEMHSVDYINSQILNLLKKQDNKSDLTNPGRQDTVTRLNNREIITDTIIF